MSRKTRDFKIKKGDRFGMLTVVKPLPEWVGFRKFWKCKCDCGNTKLLYETHLLSGSVSSCSCTKQIEVDTLTYNSWRSMKARCSQPSHKQYWNYGGRGVKVCSRWQRYYFFVMDMGRRPAKGYSIDRIDGNGHYEPDNCKWSTAAEQAKNARPQFSRVPEVTKECP